VSAWFDRFAGVTFLEPALLALALLVPVALGLARRRAPAALPLASAALLGIGRSSDAGTGRLPGSWRTRLLRLPRALHVLALAAAVVALARPAESARVVKPSEGLDLLLVLDTSSSMTAKDMDHARTRLEVARDAALAFVRGRPDDRIGLVTFARYPDLRCPLTRDHEALSALLGAVAPVSADGPEDATGIGAAVARAAQLIERGAARPPERAAGRSAAIVLLTDGEENVAVAGAPGAIAPAHAAQLCARLGVRVHAIAAGTGRRDPGGTWRPPDTRAIEDLARRTGGAFHEARDATATTSVYAAIDALERAPVPVLEAVLVDRHLPSLVLAVLLVLLGRLLEAVLLDPLP
jgi:Ca-activated chloride channel family protein